MNDQTLIFFALAWAIIIAIIIAWPLIRDWRYARQARRARHAFEADMETYSQRLPPRPRLKRTRRQGITPHRVRPITRGQLFEDVDQHFGGRRDEH